MVCDAGCLGCGVWFVLCGVGAHLVCSAGCGTRYVMQSVKCMLCGACCVV